jgi:hypothetical protein
MSSRKAFLLRMNPRLWESLEKWASDELRSVNGQIEYLLARAVREAGREARDSGGGATGLPNADRPGPSKGPAGS